MRVKYRILVKAHSIKDAPRKTAQKTLDFTVAKSPSTKDAAGDCYLEGYSNTSSKDRVGDVVLPVAFEKSLPVYLSNPIMLENHDWDKPAGFITEAKIDDKGLWVRAKVSNAREDLKTMCREGTLRTFSIGYNEIQADYDEATKTKVIQEIELLEISIVTVPCNVEAVFAVAGAAPAPAPDAGKAMSDELKTKITRHEGETTEACVSRGIQTLIGEGYEQEQAAAIAYKMCGEGKSCPTPKTAKLLKDFIADAKSACERDLTVTEVEACCDYFLSNEEIMTKAQLIAELKKIAAGGAPTIKTGDAAPGAAPAPAAAAASSGQPTPTAPGQTDPVMEALKQLNAKMDTIAQGVAQCLEGLKEDAAEDAAEDGAAPADGAKPAEGEAKPATDAGKAASEDEEKDASEDDVKKGLEELEAIEAELAKIEN